ncbi:MAG: hypothetical protein M3Z26_06355 [Bacteroidota bacterium]|nr:hypothetical protein [Bacteroidota bacterium]
MNNTFNIKRFGKLLKKTLLERPMNTYGFTGLILAVTLILYAVLKTLSGFDMAQRLTLFVGITGGSFFLASFAFGFFSTNASGSSFLTLPASHFEKWLCAVLITGVLYPLIFLIFYRIIDTSFVAIYHNSLDTASPFYKQQYEQVYKFDLNGIIARNIYIMFFIYTGAMLLGALYFNKVAVIKVALVLCAVFIFAFGLNWLLAIGLFGSIEDAAPFNHVAISAGKEIGSIELPSRVGKIFLYAIIVVFPAILWLLSFTRLREKEF